MAYFSGLRDLLEKQVVVDGIVVFGERTDGKILFQGGVLHPSQEGVEESNSSTTDHLYVSADAVRRVFTDEQETKIIVQKGGDSAGNPMVLNGWRPSFRSFLATSRHKRVSLTAHIIVHCIVVTVMLKNKDRGNNNNSKRTLSPLQQALPFIERALDKYRDS
jgi:hypothetical protein